MGIRQTLSNFDYGQVARHAAFAIIVGAASGLASVILCIFVGWAYGVFKLADWLIWLLPLMAVLEIFLYKLMKLAGNMTTRKVIDRIRANKLISCLLAPAILVTTCMSLFCGASVGKEAGALQIGASIGSTIARPMKIGHISKSEKDVPLNNYPAACGMAACFAALFFAPIGSCMFVIELTRYAKPMVKHVVTILLACFIAYFIASLIGIGDVIDKVALPEISWPIVGQCIVIGVCAALVGTLFDEAIKIVQDTTMRISTNYYLWAAIGALLFSILVTIFGWGHFTGTGAEELSDALSGRFGPFDFLIKAVLTLICLGFWLKGGEIMPSFCIGGLLGASTSFLTGGDPSFGAAIAMMAFFSAFSRCPLAAFFMGCEIFGWAAAPYLAISIFVSYMFGYPVGMYDEGIDRGIENLVDKLRSISIRHR